MRWARSAERQRAGDFVGDLVGPTEDVGVVEVDLTNPLQTGNDAGAFGPEHRSPTR